MNKNKQAPGVSGFMNKESLFKSNSKNKYVPDYYQFRSEYISLLSKTQKKNIAIPNVTQPNQELNKKESPPKIDTEVPEDEIEKKMNLNSIKKSTKYFAPLMQDDEIELTQNKSKKLSQKQPSASSYNKSNAKLSEKNSKNEKQGSRSHSNPKIQELNEKKSILKQSRLIVEVSEPKLLNPTSSKDYNPILIESLPQTPIYKQQKPFTIEDSNQSMRQQHFYSTKAEIGGYISHLQEGLWSKLTKLNQILKNVDMIISQNLELESQKIKNMFYKIIDVEIQNFILKQKQIQKYNKFDYLSQAYEVKGMIELRLDELESYSQKIKQQTEWKQVFVNILNPSYGQSIQFLSSQVVEINQTISDTMQSHLVVYNDTIKNEIIDFIKVKGKKWIRNTFSEFNSKKRSRQIVNQRDIDSSHIASENQPI